MFDFDLAEMYQVETKNLNLSVKRNIRRFPSDFMFQLTKEEWNSLRLQIETSKRGGRRYLPYAFTEQGVAMLSGLLNSDIAIDVNIDIMRAFVAVRNVLTAAKSNNTLQDLISRIKALEEISEETIAAINDLSEDTRKEFDEIYIAMSELASKQKQNDKPRKRIGFFIPE